MVYLSQHYLHMIVGYLLSVISAHRFKRKLRPQPLPVPPSDQTQIV